MDLWPNSDGIILFFTFKELNSFEFVPYCFASPIDFNWCAVLIYTLTAPHFTRACFFRPISPLGIGKVAPECTTRLWHKVVQEVSALRTEILVLLQPVKLFTLGFNFITDGWVTANAITHNSSEDKDSITVVWTPPSAMSGEVVFVVSISSIFSSLFFSCSLAF